MFETKPIKKKIIITKNGPYQVSGSLPLNKEIITPDANGDPMKWAKGETHPMQRNYDLCRCGASKNKPFCDGKHIDLGFQDGDQSLN